MPLRQVGREGGHRVAAVYVAVAWGPGDGMSRRDRVHMPLRWAAEAPGVGATGGASSGEGCSTRAQRAWVAPFVSAGRPCGPSPPLSAGRCQGRFVHTPYTSTREPHTGSPRAPGAARLLVSLGGPPSRWSLNLIGCAGECLEWGGSRGE